MKGAMRLRAPGVWELTVNLGRDLQGVRRRRTYTVYGTKTQAQRRLREIVADFDRGFAPPPSVRLADWLARWLDEHIRPNRSVATTERYEGITTKHIIPHLGHRDLDRLTPRHIQQWETQLLHDGNSPKAVGLMHTVLSGAYRHALRMELVARNPVSAVSPPSVQKTETLTPAEADVHAILRLAEDTGNKYAAGIRLLAYTGLRLGEALALTWDNVNLDEGHLSVKQSLSRRKAGMVVSSPKTATGNRTVDLDEGTVRMLREHRRQQDARRAELGEYWTERGAVFPHDSGDWLDPARITWNISKLAERVGCPGITSHSLRHFHATVLLQAGVNAVVVSKRLGHANVSITLNMYGHVLPGWQKEAAALFADAMNAAEPAGDDDGQANDDAGEVA